MTVNVVLQSSTLSVEPGQSVATNVLVRNEGADAVEVRLAVAGPGRPYSWIAPDRLSLDGGADGVVRVGFHVPRAALPAAGPLAFDVTVTGGDAAATVSGTVDVRPFALLSAILSSPDEAGGDGGKRHDLTLTNRGNAAVPAVLRAEFPGDSVDVRIEPQSVIVDSGGSARAEVQVVPKRTVARDSTESVPFRVIAEPEVGAAVAVSGECRLPAARSRRGLVVAGIVAVVALVAGAVAFASGDKPSRRGGEAPPATPVSEPAAVGALDSCPAKGQPDRFGVRGLLPHEIAMLPDTYTFLRVKSDGCSPMRFNPCEPIHYIQNAADAPPFAAENVREAFRRLARATGMTFVDDGLTDETARTGPYVPERYGERWAPILIVWEHFPAEQTTGESQVFGQTVVYRVDDVVVSGRLRFNVDAYNDEFTKAPIEAGFGPPAGSGTGAIGRHNIQWGRIVLHELAHVVGLGHNREFGSLMYPDAAQHASRPADFSRLDLEGLRHLGREAGCIPPPPVRPA